ncbi:MAG: Verru_Chthon cassette protein C [Verrucomicrobiota bacterium]|nr:Verru_Chthon cassette protein C [Verrucomicrobiota bacterium]MED6298549.1 Verru_Chthon cassette protein C [Verrucomicrobiota bacterium]MEE3176362.1 Verru_Chthon cassette protein C [Verrucomicrobiota bacterium]
MNILKKRILASNRAFTLLELMVSMVVLSLIMMLVFRMLDSTTRTWSNAQARVSTFKEARVAFEGMTRRISQAMLNTYFDYQYPGNNPQQRPRGYERKSDLHFISGKGEDLLAVGRYPTHCIFFQAPLSFSVDPNNRSFGSLLNSWGYYIQRNTDRDQIPEFFPSGALEDRERYRLMEYRPPTENLKVYASDLKTRYNTDWFRPDVMNNAATEAGKPFSIPIAENIIALIIEPKTSNAIDSTNSLAPDYEYDSRRYQKKRNEKDPTKHQLPPLIEVTMVAIDEKSALKLEQTNGGALPSDLVPPNLFQEVNSYDEDLRELKEKLNAYKPPITYRVFHETVGIRASKFSDSDLQK